MTHEELETLLIEVERIVNERPLTYYTTEEVAYPLRPIDILDCSAGNPFDVHLSPEPDWDNDYEEYPSTRSAVLEAHKKALQKSHKFWETWMTDYLLSLREKWRSKSKDPTFPKLNQVVLMNEGHEKCLRSLWKMAKIEEILSGRTVKVKTGGKIFERATSVLYPLEIESEEEIPEVQSARTKKLNKLNKNKNINQIITNFSLVSVMAVTQVRSPLLIVGDNIVADFRLYLKEEGLKAMVYTTDQWGSRLWDALEITTKVRAIIVWKEVQTTDLMESLRELQRRYSNNKLCMWVIRHGMSRPTDLPEIYFYDETPHYHSLLLQLASWNIPIEQRQYNAGSGNKWGREQARLEEWRRGRERRGRRAEERPREARQPDPPAKRQREETPILTARGERGWLREEESSRQESSRHQ
uniref:DUF5641 domain-containing protein n=1 Tax=Meloidogyne enterolobii TaxID=390850 RepID=A0A6V7W7Z3_MELEN|nr:unnamed protein product [Meloidogyne enterolobii]